MKPVIIIPARFKSSRFEGKPLALINGKAMLQHVYERCILALSAQDVFVATDDERIKTFCETNNMSVIMTSTECLTGTDRVYEASLSLSADLFINVQGDEPLVDPESIKEVIEAAKKTDAVVNAQSEITDSEEYFSSSIPKMLTSLSGNLLYISRTHVPGNKKKTFVKAYKQVCIYSFRKSHLAAFCSKKIKTPLENIEDLEILRFLEMDIPVKIITVKPGSIAVDFPEDVGKVERVLNGG